jgi:hypothetical protein
VCGNEERRMAASKGKRIAIAVVGVVAVLVVAALAGLYLVQRELKARLTEALGPLGTAERIDVGFSTIRLTNVHLRAPKGWPAADTLRADHVTIEPDIRDLLRRRVHLRNIAIDGFDLSVLRTADGRIQLLPNLRRSLNRSSASEGKAPAAREKLIDHISFEGGTFEFYDLTVRRPAYRIAVTNASASVDHMHLPELTEPTTVSAKGNIKGPSHTGSVSFGGWIKIANKDSQTTTQLRGIDAVVFDPYLLKKISAKAQVAGGTLDLTVDSTVRNYQLHAPGVITFNHLQLAESDDPLDTFLSIPTKAAVAALKAHNDQITLHFELDGNLRDPKFSLNESLATKISTGFAKALGVSVEGVAKGAGEAVKGLGGALLNLIGQ